MCLKLLLTFCSIQSNPQPCYCCAGIAEREASIVPGAVGYSLQRELVTPMEQWLWAHQVAQVCGHTVVDILLSVQEHQQDPAIIRHLDPSLQGTRLLLFEMHNTQLCVDTQWVDILMLLKDYC